jgi:hypothetical protein
MSHNKFNKKEPRPMKVLLQIALDNIEDKFVNGYTRGLCSCVCTLNSIGLIGHEEYKLLNLYIEKNIRPYSFWGRIFRKAYTKKNKNTESSYWFKPGELKPRVRYLKYLLKKCP